MPDRGRPPRRSDPTRVHATVRAAELIIAAARQLSEDRSVAVDRRRCREVAQRLDAALSRADLEVGEILAASPRIDGRRGRCRTLVEMIEADPGGDPQRQRLAALLLRALDWCE